MVYLLRKYIRTKRLSDKLDHTKLRLFKIKKILGPISFKLELLISIRIYPIFHKSLLEPCKNLNTMLGLVKINKLIQELEYKVKKIIDYHLRKGYLIK